MRPQSAQLMRRSPLPAVFVVCHSYLLDNGRDSLANTDAHRGDAERDSAPTHLMRQRHYQPCARTSQWMPQCDRAAVYVEPLFVDLQIGVAREHLRAESFVDLEQVDVADFQSGARQRFMR